jgi:sugar O-acyltransferase (sialic acid O-acetyltransferase NeuD family)
VTDLVIFGTGGFAREVHQLVEDLVSDGADWNVLGFLDDDPEREGTAVHNLPVLGTRTWPTDRGQVAVAVGLGSTPVRRRLIADLLAANETLRFPTLVHPTAWIGNRIDLGQGTVICAGSMLTTDLRLSDHVIVNLDCTIGHDSAIDAFVTVAPSVNISGRVQVGEGCDLGTSSSVIQGVSIGAWTIVGAGAVVTRDLPPNVTAVGVPASPIKERSEGWQDA